MASKSKKRRAPAARRFKHDPIFPAIEAYYAARAQLSIALSIPETKRHEKRRDTEVTANHRAVNRTQQRLCRIRPRTMNGLLELLAFLDACREGDSRMQFPFNECYEMIARAHGGLRKLING